MDLRACAEPEISKVSARAGAIAKRCANLGHVSGYDGLNSLSSAPGRGRPTLQWHPYQRGNMRSLCSLVSPMQQTGSRAPPLCSIQTNGDLAVTRTTSFFVVKDGKNQICPDTLRLQFHQKEFHLRTPLSRSAVDLEPIPKPKPRVATGAPNQQGDRAAKSRR